MLIAMTKDGFRRKRASLYVRSRVGYIGYTLPLSPVSLSVPFRPAGVTLAYYSIHGRCLDLRDMI
jgi:hypothetical protein